MLFQPNTTGALLDPSCPLEPDHPDNLGLVGCWMVPPNSGWRGGLTLRDLVRGGRKPNDATRTTAQSFVGPLGRPGGYGALNFNGTSNYVTVSSTSALNPTLPMSAAAWVRRNAIGARHEIMTKEGSSANGWELSILSSDRVEFGVFNGGSFPVAVSTGTVPAGAWYHLCGVLDSGNTLRVYINGSPDGTGAFTGSPAASSNAMSFGGKVGDAGRNLNGQIDDARVWLNRALSAAAVRSLYEGSHRGHPDSMRWLPTRVIFTPPAGGGSSGDGSSTGTSTCSGIGASTATAAGTSTGTSTVAGIGASTAAAVGTSSGTSTVAAVGAASTAAVGSADGTSTVAGAGVSAAAAAGASSGTSTVAGVGASAATSDGSADGASTCAGFGASLAEALGLSDGTSTASGVGATEAAASGSAAGTCTVSGTAPGGAVGTCAGTSTVLGVGASLAAAAGTASGTCTVLAYAGGVEPSYVSPDITWRAVEGMPGWDAIEGVPGWRANA